MAPIPIAVVGMGCRLPGGADSPEKLWKMLADGRSGWCEVPADRWNRDSFYHPNPEAKEAINTRSGYFLQEDVAAFDAGFFNVSAFEAHAMDPQQRILLETTYEALENAGMTLESLRGSDTSVHVGVYARDYDRMGYKDLPEITKLQLTGTGEAIISNRISYLLDLKGASVTIDTGCSGSMVALHQACQGLRTGESSMAIVGGTQLLLHPDQMVPMSMVGMTNPNGRCFVFDSRGSGYARGEGVGTLVLKRLEDALKDGDPIHTIIRNTGLNQDGKTAGISLPNPDSQTALMRSVYLSAGLDTRETSYVEAHGTGTQAGDNAEISSIARVFCDGVERDNDIIVGSIKSNIGHLEASSGVAGLIKAILVLQKGMIPPNIDLETPKKTLRLDERRIRVPKELTPLPGSGMRRVSVNSFGYGGTNAHIILESAPVRKELPNGTAHAFKDEKILPNGFIRVPNQSETNGTNGVGHENNTNSTNGTNGTNGINGIYKVNSKQDANEINGKHDTNGINGKHDTNGINGKHDTNGLNGEHGHSYVKDHQQGALNGDSSVEITEEIKIQEHSTIEINVESPQLFVLTAKTKDSLLSNVDNLHTWVSGHKEDKSNMRDLAFTLSTRRSMMHWRTSLVAQNRDELLTLLNQKKATKASSGTCIVFLFTGQGAQWFGMGRELITVDSFFRESILKSDNILKGLGCDWSLLEELLRDESTSRISQSEISQPASTAVQIALVQLLNEIGIKPQAVLGHSSGEIAAAYTAGALSHEAAMEVSFRRGFISSFCRRTISAKGAMLAVGIGEAEVMQYINQTRTGLVSVACVNSPDSTTISGDETAIDELKEILDGLSIFSRKLKVDTAYHSHHMKKVATEYLDSLQAIPSNVPQDDIKFYSSVNADRKSEDFGPSYWVENLVSQVRFSDGLQKLSRVELANAQHTSSVPANLFIEIGPHSALSGPVRQTMTQLTSLDLKYSYLPTIIRNHSSLRTILELAGKVFDCGHPVNLKAACSIDRSKISRSIITDLEPYSWDHSKTYWHESRLSRDHRLRMFPYHDLLGLSVVGSSTNEPVWRNHISIETLPWLRDHVVDGFIIFPGSGYLCMAIEAAHQITQVRQIPGVISRFVLREIMFSKAVIVPEQRPDGLTPEVEVQLTFKPVKNITDRSAGEFFRISSIQDGVWSEHCSGIISVDFASKLDEVEGAREEDLATTTHIQNFQSMKDACQIKVAPQELYDEIRANGNAFGPNFAIIKEAHIAHCQGIAKVVVPDIAACMPHGYLQPHIIHPTTLDAVNQIAVPLYKRHCSSGAVMPVTMEEITVAADMVNKPGSELLVALKLSPESSRSSLMDTVVFQTNSDSTMTPVVTVVRGQLRGIGEAQAFDEKFPFHRKMSYMMKLGSDVDYIKPESLVAAANDLASVSSPKLSDAVHRKLTPVDELKLYERAAALYMRLALQKIGQESLAAEITKSHLNKLFKWMSTYSISEVNENLIRELSSADVDECLLATKDAGVEGEMIARIGGHLPSILTGALDPLALMLEDGLLHRFYAQGLLVANYLQMIDYMKLLTFKNRHMTVLEVGAGTGGTTLPLIQSLNGPDGFLLNRYDYTDISAGFFEGAKNLLQQWVGFLNFKTLDISRDPIEQGFIESSYDLVIASNVLHATGSMDVTISNVRKLLKPGGRLVLVELTRLTAAMNIVFGTLPGWWASEDGRNDCPLLSIEQWSSALVRNGFNGVEFSTPDHEGPTQRSTFMVSKAVDNSQEAHNSTPTVELLYESSIFSTFAENLSRNFETSGLRCSTSQWLTLNSSANTVYVVLDDLDQPLLVGPSQDRYEKIRELLITAKSILWISARGGSTLVEQLAGNNGLVAGLARVMRRENEGMKFITFDIEQNLQGLQNCDHLLRTVSDVFSASFNSERQAQRSNETEYIYSGGRLQIPRVVTDSAFNTWVTRAVSTPEVEVGPYHQPQRPLKLHVEIPGLLSSMRFVDDDTNDLQGPLASDELQIETRACGVNFKDVFIAMGQMLPSFKMAGECSGIVRAVGSDFRSKFNVGDRVCSVGAEPFASLARVKGHFTYQLPTSMSFAVGASVPVVFLTAYHCLVEIARIRKGQTILIHAASGGVGQAALMLAQHAGAEIFATVGSAAKRQLLIEKFNLPESHIFSSRSRTFKQGVLRLTQNRGVDVVLNSLSGEMLNDSWACIAPLGTFLEIGKADIMRRGNISMVPFDRHVIFAAVDLTVLLALRPEEMPERFSKIMSMFETGALRPVEPITVMEMTNIEDAFRLIQSRKHTGKVVLEADEKTMVKVNTARPPPLKLDEQGTYVIAGGLGDLGQRICRLLAANGAKNIVTLSRRNLDSDLQSAFESDLLNQGAKVHIMACDITDFAMLEKVSSHIRNNLPAVKGIIHAGMVLRDHPMEQMDLEDYNIALAPKVQGTRNLHRMFNDESLDFFIMLSSITCILGKTGQANYSAGNAFQDAFAHTQSQANPHTRYISLNLGAIDGSEAITSLPIRQQELMRQGAILMQFDELFKLLEYAMSSQARSDGLVQSMHGFDRQSMEAVHDSFALNNPLFNLLPIPSKEENIGGPKTESVDVEKAIRNAPSLMEAEKLIIGAIAERFALFSAIPVDEINLEVSLQEFGLDSLVAIELKNWISRTFQAPVQTSEVVDATSIVKLGTLVAGRSKLISDDMRGVSKAVETKELIVNEKDNSTIARHQEKCCRYADELPKLPLIDLDNGLELFLSNVRHFCTSEEYDVTAQAVEEFKSNGSIGRELYNKLVERSKDPKTDYWLAGLFEENTWLSERGPTAPYTTYLSSHRRGSFHHSQAVVAAIIASTAFRFKQAVESDNLEPHRYFGVPSCMESWQWLFSAPREPHLRCDKMRKFVGDEYNYLVVLRRGHVFKVGVMEEGQIVSYESLSNSFQAILGADIGGDCWGPILTADNRDSWAEIRENLKGISVENKTYLHVIEGAAFVICLDDASPESPEEVVDSFYLNTGFNRWFDCGLQFIVASNGASGACVNHTMIDGLTISRLNEWINEALDNTSNPTPHSIVAPHLEEYSCTISSIIEQRIKEVREQFLNNTSRVEYHDFEFTKFGKDFLLANHNPIKGTFDLIIQVAVRLYYGYNPAVWEAISMAHFHRGRPELVQVATEPVEKFCISALDEEIDATTRHRLLIEAVKDYSNNIKNAGYGNGYHRTLEVMSYLLDKDDPIPALFTNPIYRKTAQGALISTGMTDGASPVSTFVMRGNPDCIWLLYSISDNGALFQLVGKKGSMRKFADCLNKAADAMMPLLLVREQS